MQSNELETSLIETIAKNGGTELVADIGEIALDAITDSGVIEDIPILGSLIKLKKVGIGIREHLFIKKLQVFLHSTSGISKEEREKFSDELDKNPATKQKVAETLLLLIDRIDEVEKTELLGNTFKAYLGKKIDYETFFRLGRCIDRCTASDLKFIHNYQRATDAFPDSAFDLASCGLIQIVAIPTIAAVGTENMYKITDLGEMFIEFSLK